MVAKMNTIECCKGVGEERYQAQIELNLSIGDGSVLRIFERLKTSFELGISLRASLL